MSETTEVPIEPAVEKPEVEDPEVLKQKCKELKKKILTVEDSNKLASLAILRTKKNINRLRLEYSILLERLESKIVLPNENDDSSESEIEFADKKVTKKKKLTNGSTNRDPNQPKRPLNPYLIFCDMEKTKLKKQAEEEGRTISDLSKTLGETWKTLGEEGRQAYIDIYNEEKERYQREMDIYEKGNKRQKLDTTEDPKPDDDKTQSPEPTDD